MAWESHATPIPEGLPAAQARRCSARAGRCSALVEDQARWLNASRNLGCGGAGQYGIQLGKFAGAPVTAIDLFPSRLEQARSLGADVAIGVQDSADWVSKPENPRVCGPGLRLFGGGIPQRVPGFAEKWRAALVGIPSAPLVWTAEDSFGRASGSFPPGRRAGGSCRSCCSWPSAAWSARVGSVRLRKINDAMKALASGEIPGWAVIHPGS